MTASQEREMLNTIRALRKEVSELKDMISPNVPKNDEFLTTKEAAVFLRISLRKFGYLVQDGTISFGSKMGRRNLYSKMALTKFASKTHNG